MWRRSSTSISAATGRSDRGGPAQWTVGGYAEDVRAFCDVLGIGHPVALSSGGMIAMAYAAPPRPPRQAGPAVDHGPARYRPRRPGLPPSRRRPGSRDRPALPVKRRPAGAHCLRRDVRCLVWPGRADPDAAARTVFNLELPSGPGPVMGGVDLLPELAHVTCPVLVVAGDLDPVCGADAAAEIVAALPAGLCASASSLAPDITSTATSPAGSSRSCGVRGRSGRAIDPGACHADRKPDEREPCSVRRARSRPVAGSPCKMGRRSLAGTGSASGT
jgi:pimeloyl-ACP methyl ester carboxylesterase